MNVDIKLLHPKLNNEWKIPTYATAGSVGMDLVAAVEDEVWIGPGGCRVIIPTGIAISLPPGYEAQIRPRSGLAAKYGITVLNAPGTIDSDFRAELGVILINTDINHAFVIKPGDRIAQMIVNKVEIIEWSIVNELDSTKRNDGAFGSTGLQSTNNG